VALITLGFLAVIGAFAAAAIPPIPHEAHELTANLPRYRAKIAGGKGLVGHLVRKLQLSS
jgi:predicted PurR-regulated permease PerM